MNLEPASYNAGLEAALRVCRISQRAWADSALHSTRKAFAVAALDQLAREIAALLAPPADPVPLPVPTVRPLAPAGERARH